MWNISKENYPHVQQRIAAQSTCTKINVLTQKATNHPTLSQKTCLALINTERKTKCGKPASPQQIKG